MHVVYHSFEYVHMLVLYNRPVQSLCRWCITVLYLWVWDVQYMSILWEPVSYTWCICWVLCQMIVYVFLIEFAFFSCLLMRQWSRSDLSSYGNLITEVSL